jgi:hypothetical protein
MKYVLLLGLGLAAWLGALHPAGAQATTAVAEARFDVDGDGVLDVIRIEDPAAVSVIRTGARGADATLWRPFASTEQSLVDGTIATGSGKRFGGRAVIVATAWFADASRSRRSPAGRPPARGRTGEGMVLAWQDGALVKLWEGSVGSQGHDGEYQVHVDATELGLMRYQARPDVVRCDGKTPYLFPQGYDFRQKRFRPVFNPVRIEAGAPVLQASQSAPPGGSMMPGIGFRSQSSSSQATAADAGELVPPRELDDGDPRTVWREGTGGNGRGEFITLASPMDAPALAALRIIPGNASSQEAFLRDNRLKRIGLMVGSATVLWIVFPRDPARQGAFDAPYWIALPPGLSGQCVTVVIDEVYAGPSGDTVIADLAVLTDIDLSTGGPEAALAAQVRAGGEGADAAARMLAARGPRAVDAIVAELGPKATVAAPGKTAVEHRLRLIRVLARIGDARAAEHVAAALAEPELSAADRDLLSAALVRMGTAAVPALVALLAAGDVPSVVRQRAARVLASMAGDEARVALVAAAGSGDRELRQAVATGLGQRDERDMDALLAAIAEMQAGAAGDQQGQEIGREADLWRALGIMARHAGAEARARAASALAARLATAMGYELLYRLLDAAGSMDDEAVLAAVGGAIARLDDQTLRTESEGKGQGQGKGKAEARALRRIAAQALARNRGARARALLLGLMADADPGVRRHAIAGLGVRDDGGADTDQALIARLGDDPWPRIRRESAAALARRCAQARPAAAALDKAVDGDSDIEVRRASLTALVECRAPGIAARLFEVAGDSDRPALLRQRAITLIPMLEDRELAPRLIALFSTLRKRAWSDKASVRLASAAAVALGRLGGDAVVNPLLDAAREASFPEIQAAAVTGLGEMCAARALPLFEQLVSSDQRAVAVAARGAHNRCSR